MEKKIKNEGEVKVAEKSTNTGTVNSVQHNMKIVEPNEEPLHTVIEMDGFTVKFTVAQIVQHKFEVEKTLKATESQIQVNEALDNVALAAIPALKDISSDKFDIVMRYIERQVEKPRLAELETMCKGTLDTYAERLGHIKKHFGIEFKPDAEQDEVVEEDNSVPSPF